MSPSQKSSISIIYYFPRHSIQIENLLQELTLLLFLEPKKQDWKMSATLKSGLTTRNKNLDLKRTTKKTTKAKVEIFKVRMISWFR